MSSTSSSRMSSKVKKILKRIGIGLAVTVIVLVVAVEVLLQTGALTGLVRNIASDYVDGRLQVERISGSIITHFPKVRLVLEEVSVTYPHDKFAYARGITPDLRYTEEGRGAGADTLLSFSNLDLTMSWIDAIGGEITLKKLALDSPRFFFHDYGNGVTNLDVFGSGGGEEEPEEPEEESEEEEAPEEEAPAEDNSLFPLNIGDVSITGRPHVVYTSAADGTYMRVDLEQLLLRGELSTVKAGKNDLSLQADSLAFGLVMPGDTLSVAFPALELQQLGERWMRMNILADADLSMAGTGRMRIPFGARADVAVPDRETDGALPLRIDTLAVTVASVTAQGKGDVEIGSSRIGTDVRLGIDRTSLKQLCNFLAQLYPEVGDIDTGASLTLDATLKGDFADGKLPAIDATARIPRSWIWYPGMDSRGHLRLDAAAKTDSKGLLNARVDTLSLHADGLHAGWSAGMLDVLGDDPLMRLRGFLDTSADTLLQYLPLGMDIAGKGSLALRLDGESRLSSLDAIRYPEAKVKGNLAVRGLRIDDRTDDMRIFLPQADIDLRTMENRFDPSIPQGTQVLGVKADIDTVHFRYGGEMEARGKSLMIAAQNSVLSYGDDGPMGTFTPFMVFIKAGRFGYKDGEDLLVGMRESRNSLRVSSDEVDRQIPRITLSSVSDGIFLREGVSRYMLRSTDLEASAKLNTFEKTRRRRAFMDSLQRKYPGTPKDSLLVRARTDRFGKGLPEWLSTEEFKSSDISVELDEDIKAYLRDWDVDGHARVGGGRIVTPYFRTRTIVDTLAADFSLDEVKIHDGQVHAGESHLGINGSVKNLRHAVMGRGPYMLDFELTSERLNIDSLMFAAAAGQVYDVDALRDSMQVVTVDDDAYERLVVADTLIQDLPRIDLFVVPANIQADVILYASNVKYGGVEVDNLSADAHVRERIIQITNVAGTSNLGNFFLDAFYGTQSMKDIGAGADFSMYAMDAAVLSDSFPEIFESTEGYVDRLSGDIEAQFAGVTRFDPELNPELSTTNGVLRVTGGYGNATDGSRHRLVIHNGPELRSIARWLPFINRKRIPISNLEASALIEEGQMEILPMLIRNDWYTVSIAGVQNVDPDESFQYTVSIIHSPLLWPFGVNLVGENFDDFDFDLVKSKYNRTRQIPRLDSRQKVQDAVDRLSLSVADVYRLGIGGVIAAAQPSRSFKELKQEENYEFSLLEGELEEGAEAGLRSMQEGAEDISADDYATRELTRLRKETMDTMKRKKDE